MSLNTYGKLRKEIQIHKNISNYH